MRLCNLFLVGLLILSPVSAVAQNGTGVDAQENVFGATNINATTGHGRVTVGVSREGDITVLSWPSPSLIDQLGYLSSNDLDARDQPHFGAPDGAGLFVGLRCEVDGTIEVTWLRDAEEWLVSQDYGESDGPNPHTYFRSDRLGLDVTIVDAVSPVTDTFVREVRLVREPGSTTDGCSLLTYSNLSPLPPSSKVQGLPLTDWALDGRNDFAAVWDPSEQALVHFHPGDQRVYQNIGDVLNPDDVDWGSIGAALADPAQTLDAAGVGAIVDALDDDYAAGSYVRLTTVPAPTEHQVGFDETPFCDQVASIVDNIRALPETFPSFTSPFPEAAYNLLLCSQTGPELVAEQEWQPRQDAWVDVQDGELSGDWMAAGEVTAALRTGLTFDADDQAVAHVVLGFGETAAVAKSALDAGRQGPSTVVADAEQVVGDWLSGRNIPGEPGTLPHTVARRALLNLRVGTHTETGTIVASIARQPPYYLDWPRDGAFFNVMLDASNQSELVQQRAFLYSEWKRDDATRPTPLVDPTPPVDPDTGLSTMYPGDAWEMNYYDDGTPGGTFRFEIDTTAFAVWTLVAHVGWNDEPEAYLTEHWEAIRAGADLLTRWRDEETGLHAPAQEDDQANHSQTLHGAITVFGALDVAARAARLISQEDDAERWEERARELRAGIEANFYSEEEEAFFMQESGRLPLQASGQTAVGPTAWLVWPMTLYPLDDPAILRQLERDLALIEPALDLTATGGLYYMKNTISIAVAGRPSLAETIDALPMVLASQATPDTHQFGEVMVVEDRGGEPVAQQRVSTPHLWEGALYYLTVLAVEDPTALTKYDEVLPPSRVLSRPDELAGDAGPPDAGADVGVTGDVGTSGMAAPIGEVRGTGCSCATRSGPSDGSAWLLLLAMFAWRRRQIASNRKG